MRDPRTHSGSVKSFDANWSTRHESVYNHWCADKPKNQIQFAFSQHWEVFSSLLNGMKAGRILEVGCGRGSLSSYFAAHGWDASLLDMSESVLGIAKRIFAANGHRAEFVAGDANCMPFSDGRFEVVASIGLLEHFEAIEQPIREQWRVLRPGGWVLAYIVPERPENLQRYFNWINVLLKKTVGARMEKKGAAAKENIYRSDYGSERYLPVFEALMPEKIVVTGMYSMPMISHSPEFPFSLLPAPMERMLVRIFRVAVASRRLLTGRHGWLCSERMGQAFLIAARKPAAL